jgi:hypothetical protein
VRTYGARVDNRGRLQWQKSSRSGASAFDQLTGKLARLRDFLLDYAGASMATIENLDVEVDQFNSRVFRGRSGALPSA